MSPLRMLAIVSIVIIFSCSKDDATSSGPPDPNKYTGSYVGTWGDGIGSFTFSMRIDSGDTTGKIWYAPNFTSCCGGGTMEDVNFTMTVDENTITAFHMIQLLVDYPAGTGGHCPTTADATGSFTNATTLRLDPFFFSDCDGARTVTQFQVTKQ